MNRVAIVGTWVSLTLTVLLLLIGIRFGVSIWQVGFLIFIATVAILVMTLAALRSGKWTARLKWLSMGNVLVALVWIASASVAVRLGAPNTTIFMVIGICTSALNVVTLWRRSRMTVING